MYLRESEKKYVTAHSVVSNKNTLIMATKKEIEMAKKIEYGRMLHGGDYNPEQWLDRPDILKKDIEYFKKAHINTVSVGIFSWAVLEPEEGKYNLGWLEEIIDNLYKEGISTILATPSGARPKWMADKYPEVLRMDPDHTRRFFGGRHNHCYTSPVYRQKVHDMDKLLSQRLGSHPDRKSVV